MPDDQRAKRPRPTRGQCPTTGGGCVASIHLTIAIQTCRMNGATLRLTMAQALVRDRRTAGARRGQRRTKPLFGGVFAIFGHGKWAGLGEALYAERDRLRPTAHTTSRPGQRRNRLCQAHAPPHDGGDHLDRPRRDESRHLGGARPCEPFARAVAAGRYLRLARARSRAAAARGLRRRHGERQRLLASGVAILRPHHQAGAAAHRHCRAHCTCSPTPRYAARSRWRCRRTCRPKHGIGRRAFSPTTNIISAGACRAPMRSQPPPGCCAMPGSRC